MGLPFYVLLVGTTGNETEYDIDTGGMEKVRNA